MNGHYILDTTKDILNIDVKKRNRYNVLDDTELWQYYVILT